MYAGFCEFFIEFQDVCECRRTCTKNMSASVREPPNHMILT